VRAANFFHVRSPYFEKVGGVRRSFLLESNIVVTIHPPEFVAAEL
jgi:hypothetical protein